MLFLHMYNIYTPHIRIYINTYRVHPPPPPPIFAKRTFQDCLSAAKPPSEPLKISFYPELMPFPLCQRFRGNPLVRSLPGGYPGLAALCALHVQDRGGRRAGCRKPCFHAARMGCSKSWPISCQCNSQVRNVSTKPSSLSSSSVGLTFETSGHTFVSPPGWCLGEVAIILETGLGK